MKAATVLVIGAGIDGLSTTTLCLHAKGFEIEVYESSVVSQFEIEPIFLK